MSTATQTPEEQARERFVHDIREHTMTVLRDDGVYRHVWYQRENSSFYWFDLVTWPGCLVISGDMGSYHFSRLRDMFEFFRPSGARGGFEDARWGINPYYWGEKLRGSRPGRDGCKSYSHRVFCEHVYSWADDEANHGDVEMYPDLLRRALDREVLYDDTTHIEEAHDRLDAVRDDVSGAFDDAWEWDLRDFDYAYLWCCWAIVWGISKYDSVAS